MCRGGAGGCTFGLEIAGTSNQHRNKKPTGEFVLCCYFKKYFLGKYYFSHLWKQKEFSDVQKQVWKVPDKRWVVKLRVASAAGYNGKCWVILLKCLCFSDGLYHLGRPYYLFLFAYLWIAFCSINNIQQSCWRLVFKIRGP